MSNLQEMARLVREELLTLIQPVQLLSVNPNRSTGEVSGRFRSSGMLFDYAIKGSTVRYRPVGASGSRSDALDQEVPAGPRLDAARGKPRNCTTGFACGATCIQKGKTCKAKGGAAAERLSAIVKHAGGAQAKGSGKAQSMKDVKAGVLEAFGVKTVAELKRDEMFQMAMTGAENPLKTKEDWLKVYRAHVRVPDNERGLADGPTVINGIDVIKNFRPWHVFGLNPKTATADDVRAKFRKLLIKHHPDQGGDPRMPERLKKMRDSMLALMPDERKASGRRKDSAEPDLAELLKELTVSRLALRNGWSAARRDAYREVLERFA